MSLECRQNTKSTSGQSRMYLCKEIRAGCSERRNPTKIQNTSAAAGERNGSALLHRSRKTYAGTLYEEGESVNTIRICLGHDEVG